MNWVFTNYFILIPKKKTQIILVALNEKKYPQAVGIRLVREIKTENFLLQNFTYLGFFCPFISAISIGMCFLGLF